MLRATVELCTAAVALVPSIEGREGNTWVYKTARGAEVERVVPEHRISRSTDAAMMIATKP